MHSLPGIVAVSPEFKRCLALFSLVVIACILSSSGVVEAGSDIDVIDGSPSPAPIINDALVKSVSSDIFGIYMPSEIFSVAIEKAHFSPISTIHSAMQNFSRSLLSCP